MSAPTKDVVYEAFSLLRTNINKLIEQNQSIGNIRNAIDKITRPGIEITEKETVITDDLERKLEKTYTSQIQNMKQFGDSCRLLIELVTKNNEKNKESIELEKTVIDLNRMLDELNFGSKKRKLDDPIKENKDKSEEKKDGKENKENSKSDMARIFVVNGLLDMGFEFEMCQEAVDFFIMPDDKEASLSQCASYIQDKLERQAKDSGDPGTQLVLYTGGHNPSDEHGKEQTSELSEEKQIHVTTLLSLGFTETASKTAIRSTSNVEDAVEWIYKNMPHEIM